MIVIKTRNGTRSIKSSACRTCAYGQVMRGAADSQEQIFCIQIGRSVNMDVSECNNYYNRNLPDLYLMAKTAWILEPSADRKEYGFVPYREYAKRHPHEDVLEDANNPLRRR